MYHNDDPYHRRPNRAAVGLASVAGSATCQEPAWMPFSGAWDWCVSLCPGAGIAMGLASMVAARALRGALAGGCRFTCSAPGAVGAIADSSAGPGLGYCTCVDLPASDR